MNIFPTPDKPIPWAEYCDSYKVNEQMMWKDTAYEQITLLDTIPKIYSGVEMHVVGEHISENIKLPVVQLKLPKNTMKVTIRDNFHDVCVSVDSCFPVQNMQDRVSGFFDVIPGRFEGFPRNLVYGSYSSNPQQFSLSVDDLPSLIILLSELIHQELSTEFKSAPELEKERSGTLPDKRSSKPTPKPF